MDDLNLDLDATIKSFSPGQKVGRYTLRRILGRGGMGVVWLALDGALDREVALKFLPEVVAADPQAVDDLKRETRRSLGLTHPHIVRIYDFVADARAAAIAMEYVAGDTLASRALAHPDRIFPLAELEPWLRQLCDALAYAHGKARVVHRDLKPANLMVDARGDMKVADFGIAASMTDSVSRVSKHAGSSGTPVYMSPQQMMGERPAATDDLYAFGATVYRLLTGRPPFYTGNIILQLQNKVPPTMAARRQEFGVTGEPISAAWEEVVAACLAKEAKDRPQSVAEIAGRLWPVRTPDHVRPPAAAAAGALSSTAPVREAGRTPSEPRRRPLAVGVALAVVALGGAAWYLAANRSEPPITTEVTRTEPSASGDPPAAGSTTAASTPPAVDAAAVASAREDEAHAALLAQIDTLRPGASPERRRELQSEVEAYLAAATPRHRVETERRWAERRDAWETARAEAARGSLVVRTNPPGAEVTIPEVGQAPSPFAMRGARTGRFPVKASLAGYEDWSGELEVKADAESALDIALVRSTGRLSLQTEPHGVELEILGRPVAGAPAPLKRTTGRSPAELTLPTGRYDVVLRREGWPEVRRGAEVRRNETVTVGADFIGGDVRVTSTPSGAEVLEGGKVLGRTPLDLRDILPGETEYLLRLPGHAEQRVRGTVRAREELALVAELPKRGPGPGERWTIPGLGLEVLPIAAGTFEMGVKALTVSEWEAPVTQVTLSQPYWLGRTEVTNAQWRAVMGTAPPGGGGDDFPVTMVNWLEARDFCVRLTEREQAAGRLPEGYVYSLPSEAQWEYACRAGASDIRPADFDAVAWHRGNSGGRLHPVGMKAANAWGFHDLYGNAGEWCMDALTRYPGGAVTDYVRNPEAAGYRNFRGGSHKSGISKLGMSGGLRATLRDTWAEAQRRPEVGLRVALTRPHAAKAP